MNPRPVSGCVCCGDPSKFSVFCFCACSSFSFWPVAQMWDRPPRKRRERSTLRPGWRARRWRTKTRRGKVFSQNSSVTNRDLFEIYHSFGPLVARKIRENPAGVKKWAALLLPRRPCSFPPVGKALKNRSDCPAGLLAQARRRHVPEKNLRVLNDKEAMARRGPCGGGPTEIHKSIQLCGLV